MGRFDAYEDPFYCEICDSQACRGCGRECGCDTHAEHDAAQYQSMRDFLRDPGPMPDDWDDETRARVIDAIEKDRREHL